MIEGVVESVWPVTVVSKRGFKGVVGWFSKRGEARAESKFFT